MELQQTVLHEFMHTSYKYKLRAKEYNELILLFCNLCKLYRKGSQVFHLDMPQFPKTMDYLR